MAVHYLPQDLLIDILLRLPIICFIRFRFVCKAWYVLLSDPNFIYKNLVFNYDNAHMGSYLLFKRRDRNVEDQVFYSLLSYDTLHMSATKSLPYDERIDRKFDITIIGSCNGLICLSGLGDHEKIVVLWNPATSETKSLPESHIPHPLDDDSRIIYEEIGSFFCFDARMDDYKVVTIFMTHWQYCGNLPPYIVEVYSLRSDSWKKVDFMLSVFYVDFDKQMHTNGIYSWSSLYNDDDGTKLILSFDSTLDVFMTTPLPDYRVVDKVSYATYFQFKDNIAMVTVIEHGEGAKNSFDIWVLFQLGVRESWTKLFSTAPILRLEKEPATAIGALVLWKNGKLLIDTGIGDVIILDPTTEEISYPQMNGEPRTLQIVTYIESQIQLEGRIELQHRIQELSI